MTMWLHPWPGRAANGPVAHPTTAERTRLGAVTAADLNFGCTAVLTHLVDISACFAPGRALAQAAISGLAAWK